jgi:hypothetical protein
VEHPHHLNSIPEPYPSGFRTRFQQAEGGEKPANREDVKGGCTGAVSWPPPHPTSLPSPPQSPGRVLHPIPLQSSRRVRLDHGCEENTTLGSYIHRAILLQSRSCTHCSGSWVMRMASSHSLWVLHQVDFAETQPKLHPPRRDELPSRTTLTPSSLVTHDSVLCYCSLNLALSPNSTPSPNPLRLDANRRTP